MWIRVDGWWLWRKTNNYYNQKQNWNERKRKNCAWTTRAFSPTSSLGCTAFLILPHNYIPITSVLRSVWCKRIQHDHDGTILVLLCPYTFHNKLNKISFNGFAINLYSFLSFSSFLNFPPVFCLCYDMKENCVFFFCFSFMILIPLRQNITKNLTREKKIREKPLTYVSVGIFTKNINHNRYLTDCKCICICVYRKKHKHVYICSPLLASS